MMGKVLLLQSEGSLEGSLNKMQILNMIESAETLLG